MTDSAVNTLLDFERVLEEMDLYVYDNWIDGELAYGPKVSRHWITCGFMWPEEKMPDPQGGSRLLDLGCKISYKKSHMLEPRKIRKPDDIRPGTKKGKLDAHPIWVVSITMPKKLMQDIFQGRKRQQSEYVLDHIDLNPTHAMSADTAATEATPDESAPPPLSGQ